MNRMRRVTGCAVMLVLAGGVVCLSGCRDKRIFEIRYDRKALQAIPANVKKIAVMQFSSSVNNRKDRRWGEIAADTLVSELNTLNTRYHRYHLIDRKRLSAIMDERDLQMAVSDTNQAVKLGRIAHVDAMVYGTVTVMQEKLWKTYERYDPNCKRTVTERREQRTVSVSVNFTMDDIHSSRTLSAETVNLDYDSERERNFFSTSSNLRPYSDVTMDLIKRCVKKFVARISPHQIAVRVRLDKGKTKAIKRGNNFAYAHEYADAIREYERGVAEKPKDHGAWFNMGVVYEAQRKFQKSYDCYDKALQIKDKKDYIYGRKRVRKFIQN